MTCKDCIHCEVCKKTRIMNPSHNYATECNDYNDRSRFVELPCLPGDEMFLISFYADKISKYKVFSMPMMIAKNTRWFIINLENQRGAILEDFHFSDIGKTIFLTREEAEQALKEREENG